MAAERSVEDDACPACGEPVGVRATFCMHCGRDLPDRVEYDDVTRTETVDYRPDRSGDGTPGGPSLPANGVFEYPRAAVGFLGALAVAGTAGVVGLGLAPTAAGAGVAALAWAGSVVAVARRRTGFEAVGYGSYGLMVTLVCVSLALAYGGKGGLGPVLVALVPAVLAAVFVAGLGPAAERLLT